MNPIDRFCVALEAEARAERKAKREAERLEPITIVIADQEELKRIYAILASQPFKDRPGPMIRRHLRGWSWEQFDKLKADSAA